jgi:uncharacterized BrkB/YihY/UPF0761 family membrane protein
MPVLPPASRPLVSGSRWLTVLGVGVMVSTVCALPASYLGYVAVSAATACGGQCGEPDAGLAVKAVLLVLILLAVPVLLMVRMMPKGQRARWSPAFAVLVLAVVALVGLVWARSAFT